MAMAEPEDCLMFFTERETEERKGESDERLAQTFGVIHDAEKNFHSRKCF